MQGKIKYFKKSNFKNRMNLDSLKFLYTFNKDLLQK